MVSSMMADTMSPSAALRAFTAFGLLTPAWKATRVTLNHEKEGSGVCFDGF